MGRAGGGRVPSRRLHPSGGSMERRRGGDGAPSRRWMSRGRAAAGWRVGRMGARRRRRRRRGQNLHAQIYRSHLTKQRPQHPSIATKRAIQTYKKASRHQHAHELAKSNTENSEPIQPSNSTNKTTNKHNAKRKHITTRICNKPRTATNDNSADNKQHTHTHRTNNNRGNTHTDLTGFRTIRK